MKKTGLFKIIMFVLLGILVLTWLIPASYFSGEELVDLGMYRIGFFDFFQLIFRAFQFRYFIQILILLVSIGALYGVLAKTGKYRAWIEKIASKFKGKEILFVIIIASVIALLTSAFDYGLALFIFIPAIISIILCMGYDKVTAILSTFGAMLIGTIGATLNENVVGSINAQLANATYATGIYYKIALLVLSLATLIFFLTRTKKDKSAKKAKEKAGKTTKKKEEVILSKEEDLFLGEKISNVYPVWPIYTIFIVLFVIMVLGLTPWETTFGISIFSTFNNAISEFSIKDITIFKFLLGSISALGEWYYAEMSVISILAALLLGKIYGMKISDTFTNMKNGALRILPAALMVVLTYVVIYFAGNTMFFNTIADKILSLTKNFNLLLSSITMILGSAIHVDMLYVTSYLTPQFAGMFSESHTLIAILSQGLHGVTMLIAPTSALLVLGLSYLGVSYKEWVKKTWKLTLTLLAIIIIIAIIAALI